MDGAQEFANKLNFIERELTALKTAHRHPLGSMNLYQKRQNVSLPDGFAYITVKVAKADYTPIVQFAIDKVNINGGLNDVSVSISNDNTTYEWIYEVFPNVGQSQVNTTVSVVASVEVLSITTRGI